MDFATFFTDRHFYAAAVPTYAGGVMTFAWVSDNPALRQLSLETRQQRFVAVGIKTHYYNPAIHLGGFALPQYVVDALAGKSCLR
ncbi:MAG: hypothetical protein J7K75_02675 [Desulfuromonas sp.]|nr:hypothetical protein [Desulfuromonas sp.]